LWSREVEDELELELESESESEDELESESESEPDDDESEPEEAEPLRRLLDPACFSSFILSFSLSSRILFAIPFFLMNSSGTSTEGLPSALSLASSFGFSSCWVRDGRET